MQLGPQCNHVDVEYEEALARVLPSDIPNRDRLVDKAATHLRLVASANEYMNLTRITDPGEAAVKHVFDSAVPWKHFWGVQKVMDAGSGAGFPGIPLAVLLPDVRFVLCESIQKKARFVESVVEALELPNVYVAAQRAEETAITRHPDIITTRAMAPSNRMLELFAPAMSRGARLILYKGPNAEQELLPMEKKGLTTEILCRYDLPDGFGARMLLEFRLNASSGMPRKRVAATRR